MDGISIITSCGNGLTPVNNPGITTNHWNHYGFPMEDTQHHSAQATLHGHVNLFGSNGSQPFNPLVTNMIRPGCPPDVWRSNGRYPSAVVFGDKNSCFSTPFGGRKRVLDDEDDHRVKRQRVSGASMAVYNGVMHPQVMMMNDVMEPTSYGANSSMVEHRSTVAAVHGYEDYLCNILISQLYGC